MVTVRFSVTVSVTVNSFRDTISVLYVNVVFVYHLRPG